MAIRLRVLDNNSDLPLSLDNNNDLPLSADNGSPYYVGARAYVTQTENGATVTVIDKDGTTTAVITNGADGQDGADGNGIASIDLTSTVGNVDTYTITYTDGTTDTFDVTNGIDGQDGQDGADGQDGQDGFSPTATVSKVGDTATISITDLNGTTTATVKDGADGQDGSVVSIDSKTSSGTNIADITIDGVTTQLYAPDGGGGASAFVAEFNVTTYADVKDAYDNDAILVCTVDDSGNTMVLQFVYFDATNEIFFFAEPNGDGFYWTELSNANGWDDGTRYLASTDVATQLADGLMSALDKQKLDGLSKRNIWYGTCSTSASQSPKAITTASGDFSLTAGNMLVVKFSNTNSLSSASLQVDGGTAKSVYQLDGTSNIANRWGGGEVVMFAYDGTKFILLDQTTASTTQYGITKLNNTTSSTSTSEAATANAVKAAYDNGGVQSVNGNTGAVTLTIPTDTGDLTNGAGFITGMEILSYGSSTWNDFITAYNAKKVVYCRASSNANPASGSQTRLAFMAYVNNAASPTSVEFQYYRSVSSHSASQQGDQVFVYTLTSAGTWTVTTREASSKVAAGTGLSSAYSNGTVTLSATSTSTPTADTISEFDSTAHMNSTDMTAQEVEDFVDGLDAQGANLADYVVEQGTSGIWTYRKWNSGIAECWGETATESKAFTSSIGSSYYAPKISVSYPSGLFIARPSTEMTLSGGGLVLGSIALSTNNATTVEGYPVSPNNTTNNVSVAISAKGRWK